MPKGAEWTPEHVEQTLRQHIEMMRRLCGPAATTREGRMRQQMYADATVLVALKTVCHILPVEIQATLQQLFDQHEAAWSSPREKEVNR